LPGASPAPMMTNAVSWPMPGSAIPASTQDATRPTVSRTLPERAENERIGGLLSLGFAAGALFGVLFVLLRRQIATASPPNA
jgi:hypothetical protein